MLGQCYDKDTMKGVLYAVLAASLFGASTPLAKSLLPQMTPLLLAGLLYLGSGVGLAVYSFLRSRRGDPSRNEAALTTPARRTCPHPSALHGHSSPSRALSRVVV